MNKAVAAFRFTMLEFVNYLIKKILTSSQINRDK